MGLPNLSSPVKAYMQSMIIGIVSKEIIDHELVETIKYVKTKGVKQPLDPQELEIYNTGQRDWKWFDLHLLPKIKLKPDDVIIIKKIRYRVMTKFDCSEYGYIEYFIAQTFEKPEEQDTEEDMGNTEQPEDEEENQEDGF